MRRRDLLIGLALFGAALIVRWLFAARLPFPPLDDPAFYVQTARNLAMGRGLVIDAIWSYQLPFVEVTHASHEYWMPLATFLMAPFIRLLGDTLFAAQMPGILCAALLSPMTYGLARYVWPQDRWPGVAAAALLIPAALPIYQSASTDSAAPFALCASLALIAGGLSIERGSTGLSFAAGVLGGLAYLARSDGLLAPLCIAAYMALRPGSRRAVVAPLLGLLAGAAITIGPWWLRNLAVFGQAQSVSPLAAAALQSYGQLFNWNEPPTLSGLLDRGLGFVIDLRLKAVLHNLSVLLTISFPYGLYGLPGLFLIKRPVIRLGLIYLAALFLASALIFSVPTLSGLFYHSAAAALPWLAVGGVGFLRSAGARRAWRPVAVGLYAATLVLIAFQSAVALPAAIADGAANQAKFAYAAEWLRGHAPSRQPVIATQAHTLNYASGYPALTLPNRQGVEVLRELAGRYGARFVVVTERVGLYPDVLDVAEAIGVRKRLDANGVVIYELP